MTEQFKALVLTYKSAPVEIREQVSLQEGSAKELLLFLKSVSNSGDWLVVSTCNRTEIYYYSATDYTREIFTGLVLIKKPAPGFETFFESLTGTAAIRHLFYVGIGLDAQVLGDLQISGQVKNAYQWSADTGVAGPFLHRLMHTIFFVNKRVVQETSFRDGAASISYAAKELAIQLTGQYQKPRVLLVGVGEIGHDVALNLQNGPFESVTILNRTETKAEALASSLGFRASSMDQLAAEIMAADVIISTVAGQQPLIEARHLTEPILRHKFFIDLSMPRSIAPELEQLAGVVLYNLDDITARTTEALQKRRAAIPKVEAIIENALMDFNDWSRDMIVSPVIQKLKNTLEQIRQEELGRWLRNASPEEYTRLEEMSKSLVQKILKYPVLELKAACRRGDAENMAEVLQELFDIEKHKSEKPRRG